MACITVYGVCKDELLEMIRDCRPSFIVTDIDHVDRVQFAAASRFATAEDSAAANLNVRYLASEQIRCVCYGLPVD